MNQQNIEKSHKINLDNYLPLLEKLGSDFGGFNSLEFDPLLAELSAKSNDPRYRAILDVLLIETNSQHIRRLTEAINQFNQDTGNLYKQLNAYTFVIAAATVISVLKIDLGCITKYFSLAF